MFQQLMSMVPAQLFFRMKFKENPRKTRIKKTYLGQDEFILITNFLSTCLVSKWFFYYRYLPGTQMTLVLTGLRGSFGGLTFKTRMSCGFQVAACFHASASPPSIEALEMMSGKIFAVKQSIVDDTWRVQTARLGWWGRAIRWGKKLHSIWDWKLWLFDVLFSRL